MQAWEIIVIVAGCCLVALTTYLIIALRRLISTLSKVDALLEDNTSSVKSIVDNVDGMTSDARNMVGSVTSAASNITDALKPKSDGALAAVSKFNLPAVLTFAASAYSVFKAYKAFSDRKKEKAANKEYKKYNK